ncbi:MAG: nuclear transport factor 2 family protein [Leptospirales bacterium]|nr:nuclear transport factor 2 family protein [Leptospirales bacterium]
MHPNEALIDKFYSAFTRKDWQTMVDCYHDDIDFADPVFQLQGWKAKAMWQMLAERATDLTLTYGNIKADDTSGQAHWEPVYSFAKTGNKIHNIIDARFEFKDGKIIKHRDTFSLWRWAGMALGLSGKLMGWSSGVQNKIRAEAATGLEMFIKRKKLGPK